MKPEQDFPAGAFFVLERGGLFRVVFSSDEHPHWYREVALFHDESRAIQMASWYNDIRDSGMTFMDHDDMSEPPPITRKDYAKRRSVELVSALRSGGLNGARVKDIAERLGWHLDDARDACVYANESGAVSYGYFGGESFKRVYLPKTAPDGTALSPNENRALDAMWRLAKGNVVQASWAAIASKADISKGSCAATIERLISKGCVRVKAEADHSVPKTYELLRAAAEVY